MSSGGLSRARLDRSSVQFLYSDADLYYFMDSETFEQTALTPEQVGEAAMYLKLNEVVKVQVIDQKPISVELPATVVLEVKETEPGLRGATVTNVTKPAKLETGAVVKVPNFVEVGDKVKVDTRSGEFLGRA